MAEPNAEQQLAAQMQAFQQRHEADQAMIAALQAAAAAAARQPPQPREPQVALPERFSGQQSRHRDFVAAVQVIFDLQPSRFADDRAKILFMSTLLDGAASTWFRTQRESLSPDSPILTSFAAFLAAFASAFGDPHAQLTAIRRLQNCRQGQRSVASYAADFGRIAIDTQYNDVALREAFRLNLSEPVKDLLTHLPPVATLQELITAAIQADIRLSDRRLERAYDRSSTLSPALRARLSFPRDVVEAGTHVAPSAPRPAAPSSSSAPTSTPMEIGALGRRGPLPAEERARRDRMGLCRYCGEPGHIAINCPNKPQSRLATINNMEPAPPGTVALESEN